MFSRYTWLGDSNKYPKVKSIRYPKERSINPNVTVYVVDLSVLKFINKIQIKPPSSNCNDSYVGNMIWLSPTDLSVTFTNREQTSALTVLCRAPTFNCTEVSVLRTAETKRFSHFHCIADSHRNGNREWLGPSSG